MTTSDRIRCSLLALLVGLMICMALGALVVPYAAAVGADVILAVIAAATPKAGSR